MHCEQYSAMSTSPGRNPLDLENVKPMSANHPRQHDRTLNNGIGHRQRDEFDVVTTIRGRASLRAIGDKDNEVVLRAKTGDQLYDFFNIALNAANVLAQDMTIYSNAHRTPAANFLMRARAAQQLERAFRKARSRQGKIGRPRH